MWLKKVLKREKGQGLVEYALILVLIAIVVIAILALLGPSVGEIYSNVLCAIEAGGNNTITSVLATEAGGQLTVVVEVSSSTTVDLSGSVTGSRSCSSSCTFSFGSYPEHGSVRAMSDAGGCGFASW